MIFETQSSNVNTVDKFETIDSAEDEEYLSSVETEEGVSNFLEIESNESTNKRKKQKKGHEKRHNFCIQKSVFRNILKELSEGRSISEEAVNILHSTAENYIVDIFVKSKKLIDQTNRKTLTDEDVKLVLELIK